MLLVVRSIVARLDYHHLVIILRHPVKTGRVPMYLVINGRCVYVLGGRAFEWNIKTLENSTSFNGFHNCASSYWHGSEYSATVIQFSAKPHKALLQVHN